EAGNDEWRIDSLGRHGGLLSPEVLVDDGAARLGVGALGFGHDRAPEVCAEERGAHDAGAFDARAPEVSPGEIGAFEVAAAEVCVAEISGSEAGSSEHVVPVEFDLAEIDAFEVAAKCAIE